MSARVFNKAAPVARAYIRYASTESAAQKASTSTSQGLTKTLCGLYKTATGILEPVLYYSEVAFHVFKQTFYRQSFSLPTKADFAVVETQLFKALEFVKIQNLKNVKSLKDVSTEKWKSGAIKAFELSSLFVIGEAVGRGNLIGYKD
ncbi:hypothetical protein DL89DRAFT_255948 [Linderina pennispora]|uniref:Uncharacterized protein n=1 Tax=Linderina pennispora TaxID=61395 RepID=A0A1Y1WFH6_9FUNG|nr:uncharacterized protein DL89DRAFT_255948 [Linderina pennispora]ORX72300.1 hypothetical protein DL89DRAFT_255948 [Linderina pennispora]